MVKAFNNLLLGSIIGILTFLCWAVFFTPMPYAAWLFIVKLPGFGIRFFGILIIGLLIEIKFITLSRKIYPLFSKGLAFGVAIGIVCFIYLLCYWATLSYKL